MKNKSIFVIIATILVATVIGVGFYFIEKGQGVKNTQNVVVDDENIDQDITSPEDTTEPINDEDLVWYEVPELGIKFKVTPDTKDDLGYSFKKYGNDIETFSVMFYSKNETDENLRGCSVNEKTGWNCGWFQLVYEHKEGEFDKRLNYDNCNKVGGKTYVVDEYNNLCSFRDPSNGVGVISDKIYKDFFHAQKKIESGIFGAYLNTLEFMEK